MLSTSERPESIFNDYPSDWPSEQFYVNQGTVTRAQRYRLTALIKGGASEVDVEAFFNENPAALSLVLTFFQTGHHASWIIPKQMIRARLSDTSPGLIPRLPYCRRKFGWRDLVGHGSERPGRKDFRRHRFGNNSIN